MDDLISRQAAIDALRAMQTYKLFAGDDMLLIDQAGAQTELMLLPSAQPKMGRWIHDGSKWTNRWICSECGYKWFFDCIEGAYCPNCGAKMEVTE